MSKRVVITGASSGLGREMALEYARRGARLILVARRSELLDELAVEVRELGGDARTIALDVTERGAPQRIVALCDEAFDGFDVVIMNAGVGFPMFIDAFDADGIERVMDVNFVSAVRMIEAVLPRMLASRSGQLVAVTSLASFRGAPGSAAYNASKAALTIFMESLRTELRDTGVLCTTILPGFVRTEMSGKNEFRMPFILEADDAGRRMVRAIERGARDYRFPLSLNVLTRLATMAPNWLYDWFVAYGRKRLARKPT